MIFLIINLKKYTRALVNKFLRSFQDPLSEWGRAPEASTARPLSRIFVLSLHQRLRFYSFDPNPQIFNNHMYSVCRAQQFRSPPLVPHPALVGSNIFLLSWGASSLHSGPRTLINSSCNRDYFQAGQGRGPPPLLRCDGAQLRFRYSRVAT